MKPHLFYIEVDGVPVPVEDGDVESWGRWNATADRRVAQDEVGPYWISTVFLGLDHNFVPGGLPLLYETIVFGPPEVFEPDPSGPESDDPFSREMARALKFMAGREFRPSQDMERYPTRELALEGHRRMVERWSIAWDQLRAEQRKENGP